MKKAVLRYLHTNQTGNNAMYIVHYLTGNANDITESVKAGSAQQAESIVLHTNECSVIILSIFKLEA